MKLRPPSVPLITVDPYFSVWSAADRLYDKATVHWTDSPNTMDGLVLIDGEKFRFMGKGSEPVLEQVSLDMTALITKYSFANDKIQLTVEFFTPLLLEDLHLLSRPVSYVGFTSRSLDGRAHEVEVSVAVSEEICIDKKGDLPVECSLAAVEGMQSIKIGSLRQELLSRSGDDLRIDWGYFYLSVPQKGRVEQIKGEDMSFVGASLPLSEGEREFMLFAYDDIKSIDYFGYQAEALWHQKWQSIEQAIASAYAEAEELLARCELFSERLVTEALAVGGEKYADLLCLAYRQSIAAHKTVTDSEGKLLFISKECFSNGCAATVDVTYPSSPLFLIYNTELLKGMLRPIYKFAASEAWEFDFAPHDAGQYPLLLGQVYGTNHIAEGKYLDYQMPVEECGNMLIMMTNIALRDGNTDFFDEYSSILSGWVKYLEKYGMDPGNQLCTDDFAGHLAHNCNLALKAIMGLAGYALLLKMKNNPEWESFMAKAREMGENWQRLAASPDGSFKLTYDMEATFSMKYNMIWDKLWGTGIFAPSVYNSEFSSYRRHMNAYGLPLDSRRSYTKSDWIAWTGVLAPTREDFEEFIAPMWQAYHVSPSRIPMSDWYDTVTSEWVGFCHRSVQAGLFIKLLNFGN